MRNVLIAAIAVTAAALAYVSTTGHVTAAPAAHSAMAPGLQTLAEPGATKVDWKINRRWHRGCERWRWAKHRKWVCGAYGNCRWRYSSYYWGQCYKPGGPPRRGRSY
ncbi:MAG: hypothetical protein ACR2PO_06780 [Methyloligellaceae bacterium]